MTQIKTITGGNCYLIIIRWYLKEKDFRNKKCLQRSSLGQRHKIVGGLWEGTPNVAYSNVILMMLIASNVTGITEIQPELLQYCTVEGKPSWSGEIFVELQRMSNRSCLYGDVAAYWLNVHCKHLLDTLEAFSTPIDQS